MGTEPGSNMTAAAHVLRKVALDEGLKARVAKDPDLRRLAARVARRYVAGDRREDALDRARQVSAAGHRVTVDFMGESARTRAVVDAATDEFLDLVTSLRDGQLGGSVSLDLSHLGSVLDRELGRANVARIAEATAAGGMELLISMEGHDRVDQILEDHRWLCERFDHVGVTLAARLHRTEDDLAGVLQCPGRIRLVKGAYDTPADIALAREDPELTTRFDRYVDQLLDSGHACSIATHDADRLAHLHEYVQQQDAHERPYVVEMLAGLDSGRLDEMRDLGHPTQEYIVYGTEWWLYVCNRIAEEPTRLFDALVDAADA
ncbi:proline dehydrogenase family protein [Nitriliruptor alkaliphilus]|uniref:proline dehydrogenase family protein n=1 Tax=Nitriliruptor alkaliphilus TaxID=427918 RepID=UPI000A7EB709|nr:proline dehydrogenase family protein [Nitriliruptor alkaliphilus]